MMVAYHIFVVGGLVVSIILLVSVAVSQARFNRWWDENFDIGEYREEDYHPDDEPELTGFEQEVADLHDEPLA